MPYVIAIILLAVLIFVLVGSNAYQREQRKIKNAGNTGEAIFTSRIRGILRGDDVLINNISLSVNGKEAEIDNLIINKNGIFIVEVKNYNGKLFGNTDDYEWTKVKISPGGNAFSKQVKNPIKQMKRQIYILSQYLKENNIRIWINGYAYFINSNSPVNDECVINDISELDRIIHKQQDKVYDEKVIHKAINLLSIWFYLQRTSKKRWRFGFSNAQIFADM